MIGKDQRALMPLARLHVGKILLADYFCNHFADRQQERFRRAPAPHLSDLETSAAIMAARHDLREGLVTLEQSVQWFQ